MFDLHRLYLESGNMPSTATHDDDYEAAEKKQVTKNQNLKSTLRDAGGKGQFGALHHPLDSQVTKPATGPGSPGNTLRTKPSICVTIPLTAGSKLGEVG